MHVSSAGLGSPRSLRARAADAGLRATTIVVCATITTIKKTT